jgi:hypothetical protein
MFDDFGKNDPRKMPSHLFSGALNLDYTTATSANVSKQNRSICPRHWYVDAAFHCGQCGDAFVFTANEQQYWYEELGFWIESIARNCAKCRHELRTLKALRQEYDRDVAASLVRNASLERKQRLLEILNALDNSGVKLPDKVHDNRRTLATQIEQLRHSGAT